MASSAQLERRAERARERLTDRIADLRYHVSPATVVGELIGVNPSTLGDEILPLIAKQARNNPVASLLIGAGIGWLIFSEVRGPLSKMAFGTPRKAKRGKKRVTRKAKAVAATRSK
ncbi:MAG TPA: hypothetical protein VGI09_08935 [Pseudolabrys sp.]|jgi:hypothetical protein